LMAVEFQPLPPLPALLLLCHVLSATFSFV
jgi:hypothetical protein